VHVRVYGVSVCVYVCVCGVVCVSLLSMYVCVVCVRVQCLCVHVHMCVCTCMRVCLMCVLSMCAKGVVCLIVVYNAPKNYRHSNFFSFQY